MDSATTAIVFNASKSAGNRLGCVRLRSIDTNISLRNVSGSPSIDDIFEFRSVTVPHPKNYEIVFVHVQGYAEPLVGHGTLEVDTHRGPVPLGLIQVGDRLLTLYTGARLPEHDGVQPPPYENPDSPTTEPVPTPEPAPVPRRKHFDEELLTVTRVEFHECGDEDLEFVLADSKQRLPVQTRPYGPMVYVYTRTPKALAEGVFGLGRRAPTEMQALHAFLRRLGN